MTQFKVDLEMAEQEFKRFADAMDLDVSAERMDEDDKKSFKRQKDIFILAVQKGSLAINANGEPVFSPQRTKDIEPLVFHEPTGATLLEMDRRKDNETMAKTHLALAAMTKKPSATFAKMAYADLKVCTAIMSFFLG